MKNHLMVGLILGLLVNFHCAATFAHLNSVIGSAAGAIGEQPLSKIAIHKAKLALQDSASIKATPIVLGIRGEDTEWVDVDFEIEEPSNDDWIGVFSPAKFNASSCYLENDSKDQAPCICSSPIKYKFANFSNSYYTKTGKASLKFQLINQRADFSFAFFAGGLSNRYQIPLLLQILKHHFILALLKGNLGNEMTVTWTSGHNIDEAIPFLEWGLKGHQQKRSPAGTLTFERNAMCGSPARTVGWRDPGFIHTSFLRDLWPNTCIYLQNGSPINKWILHLEQDVFLQIVPISRTRLTATCDNLWRHGEGGTRWFK
ncbi:putative inactive purple acid phosphatase 27 [Abeliophyllum distichum]|uniref:Inactive purple acid phosphatase 27 n=1 Tax=Abeliophyllum distichum TaxID=126358 RepID=A0ABD1UIJ8_9LAMI